MIESADEAEKIFEFNYFSSSQESAKLLKDSLQKREMEEVTIIQFEENLWAINGLTPNKISISEKDIEHWEKEMTSIGTFFECDFEGWEYEMKE